MSNSDIAKNGTTVYIDSLSSVVKFENNLTSVITSPGLAIHRFPLTDGFHLVYQEQQGPAYYSFLESSNGRFMLFTGLRGNAPLPYTWYQVNNKYCAYLDIPMKDVISAGLLKFEFRVIDTSGNKIFIDSVNRVSGYRLIY